MQYSRGFLTPTSGEALRFKTRLHSSGSDTNRIPSIALASRVISMEVVWQPWKAERGSTGALWEVSHELWSRAGFIEWKLIGPWFIDPFLHPALSFLCPGCVQPCMHLASLPSYIDSIIDSFPFPSWRDLGPFSDRILVLLYCTSNLNGIYSIYFGPLGVFAVSKLRFWKIGRR